MSSAAHRGYGLAAYERLRLDLLGLRGVIDSMAILRGRPRMGEGGGPGR